MLPDSAGETSHGPQVRSNGAALDPADHRLADARSRRKPTLCQPCRPPSDAHLLTETVDGVLWRHRANIA
jgi:hypothetical protein